MAPGRQRMVRLIGRQQTLQSSISDCSDCEVSICNGKTSPHCGQVTSVSTINCIVAAAFYFGVISNGVEISLDISQNIVGPTVHVACPTRSIPRLRSG